MAVDVMTLLPARPPLFALDLPDRLLLWAMREWLAAALSRKPVTPALRKGLDSFGLGETAAAVARFMDEAANAWPERLRLHPARCGCPISYDESLLLACVADASRDARSAFDARLHEMIGQSMRDRMWRAAVGLAKMIGRLPD